jgi:kinesin family protein 3/17
MAASMHHTSVSLLSMQDSLGGNCRTTIIATVSPSVDAFEETVSTLKFADRASAIGNNPVVNTSRDLNSVLALKVS